MALADPSSSAAPPSEVPLLVEVSALRARLEREGAGGPRLRLLELRWSPAGPSARERYLSGHIPGALFVDLDRDLSHAQKAGRGGRHPMVSPAELAALLARLGVGEETQVIAYDDGSGQIAARLWLQLRLHGHRRVSLLDGGLWAWTQAGLPLETAEAHAPPAPLRALVRDEGALVDRVQIAALVAARKSAPGAGPLLLDARAPERYRGESEPLDRAAGHIPGALNVPGARFTRGAGDPRWRSPEEIRGVLAEAGVLGGAGDGRALIASCGSGVTACHLIAALEQAGAHGAKLYAGSYSDWLSDPDAEVARGGEPG